MKLTAAETKSAATRPGEKPIKLADGAGMFLLINPNGVCGWRLKYRIAGKEKLISLGPYPEVSLAEAREKAQEARKLVKTGMDPSAARQTAKRERAETLERTFENAGALWLATWQKGKAEASVATATRHLMRLNAALGKIPTQEIESRQVTAVVQKIQADKGPGVAARCLRIAIRIFQRAKAEGWVTHNPASELGDILAKTEYDHFKAQTTPDGLAEVLKKIEGYPSPVVRSFLKILPVVFCRQSELRAMRWDQLDLDGTHPEWRFRISKTATDHIVPLPTQVVAILKDLRRMTGSGEFVFAGKSKSGTIDKATISYAMKQSLGIEDQVAHGFRASARTLLDEVLGFRPDFIEHQLGHAVRDANGRAYNRTTHLPERRKMLQVWADYLDGLRGGEVASNVVALRKVG